MKKYNFKIGDWVTWHSKKKERYLTGQIFDFNGGYKAYVIWTTWDGRYHRWIVPLRKLRKVKME